MPTRRQRAATRTRAFRQARRPPVPATAWHHPRNANPLPCRSQRQAKGQQIPLLPRATRSQFISRFYLLHHLFPLHPSPLLIYFCSSTRFLLKPRRVRFPEQVFFTKQSKKKKKIWEDGVLVVKQGCMELQVVLVQRWCTDSSRSPE